MKKWKLRGGAAALLLAIAMGGSPALAAGHDITIVVPEQPDNMEICNLGISNIDIILAANVAEALTKIDAGTGKILPVLATSWERTSDTVWRFHLRQGVKFQDGAAFNAAAVVAAVNRVMDGKITCQTTTIYFNSVKLTATAVDDETVDITTSVPTPILPTLLIGLFIGSPNSPTDAPATTPIGTGPYKLASFSQGESVKLERFDGYWGEKPVVDSATYVWRAESTVRAGMVANNEATIASSIALEDATDPKLDFPYLRSEVSRIRIDPAFPPLNDARVRKALNLAVDREALKDIFGKDAQIATQLVVPGTVGYNADLKPWAYDPDQAKKLIAEAKADGVNVDAPITLVGRNGIYPHADETIEALLSMWSDIGLKFNVKTLEVADWLKFIQKPVPEDRGPNLVQDNHGNSTGDAIVTLNTKYYSQARSSPLTDKKLDAMIDAAQTAQGDDRQKQIAAIFAYMKDDLVADVPLFYMVGYARVSPSINWRPDRLTTDQIELAKIGFTN